MSPDESFAEVETALQPAGAERSHMMGRPMLKIGSRMFACLDAGALALRLGATSTAHADALAIDGATLFSPGKGRTFKDWVSLPHSASSRWLEFAELALEHTAS